MMKKPHDVSPSVWLSTPGSWHLPRTAKAFEHRNALAGVWISDKNSTQVQPNLYRRCWPFHLLLKPFLHFAPQIWTEKMFYALFPVWKAWLRSQRLPQFNAAHSVMGFSTEPFDLADKVGALKVIDCPNSHPTTYYGFWQRECDIWCPGEQVPVPRWMFARMNRELERADLILCPSLFVRESMIQNGLPAEKCFLNPFGADTSIFKPREVIPDAPRFISVGTICLRKGFHHLFRAFEKVRKTIPGAELICVSDFKTDFRMEAPRWKGKFTHIPGLPHPELADLLKTCTAFVFPSMEEGFARVIPEAMAAGLPIIASHESGASTLVSDGIEGFIIHPKNIAQVAEKMLLLSTDSALCQKMGRAAYAKGAVSNTWQDYGDRLLCELKSRLSCDH